MNTTELLARLRTLGVRLSVVGGELKVSAPKGALSAELMESLKAKKGELLRMLSGRSGRGAGSDGTDEDEELSGPIARVARDGTQALSFGQKRLWFLQQLEPDLAAYNIPLNWNLRGPLNVAALERSLSAIVERHESLRTVFPERDGVPAQLIQKPAPVRLPIVENEAALPAAAWRKEVLRRMTVDAETAFDLARGPLYRPLLYRLSEEEHALCVCVHHAIFDGVSIGVLLDEMIAGYEAILAGEEAELPPLSVQYVDYAAWQNATFETAAFRRHLDFWRETLGGDLPVLELPTDRPRPPVQSYRGDREELPVPADVVDGLNALAKAEGATLFMVMLAAYKVLLYRYTGQEDLLVGTAINGRDRTEIERLIGFFVNTLVIRTDLSADPSFRELIGRVRERCLDAFEHHQIPFERLVDELQPARNLSYSPIFQTLFLNELDPDPPRRMGPLVVQPHGKEEDLEFHIARNDICFWVSADEDGLIAWAEYNTDLFDAVRMRRMLGHYIEVCRSLFADPDASISSLGLLPEAERNQLLVDWNRQGEPFPEEAIHARFEAQVEATPDAVALLFPDLGDGRGDVRLSYRELDAAANRLARRLVELRVEPGSLVGMCLERSPAMLIAMLAIQKAGAAYVPLDPSYPAERLVYMAEDSHLAFVVTHGELDRLFASIEGLCIVHLEREAQAIDAQDAGSLGLAVDARERMYVIYTSGSTGRPKGVQLEHRSVSNFLSSMAAEPGLTAGELLLALTTPSFDISVLELFLPLVSGATVAIAPREATADGSVLKALIERLEPDVMQATPASWRMLLVAGWQGASELRAFCGGEALARELADELLERSKELWNLYGPTEATIWSSVERVGSEGPITIGKPIQNTRIYVLDKHRNPVPVGVTGELWIAGDGLARGYLERPELDRERFVPDPFYAGPGAGHERMYVTGDLARWRADGRIECLGRVDHQVKLRGFRIELGEIESVLAEVPGVHECVAIVREDTPGDQRLAAYYTLEAGQAAAGPAPTIDHERLRQAGRERLPAYMVPSLFQALDALPLTPNGKVDRNALHALDAQGALPEVEYVAPQNATEERIAAIWGAVLGLERVTVHTNFFDLGGHSLLLAQVHARLQQQHPELSIIELFQYPTVRALAEHLEGAGGDARDGARDGRKKNLAAGREALMKRRRVRR